MPATEKGRTYAIAQLRKRRAANAKKKRVKNESLPAGSPMFFYCSACGADIVVPESYVVKPSLCPECGAMHNLGWLE